MTKKEIIERCKKMLNNQDEPIDYDFLLSKVFPLHPEWEQKQGVGIKEIKVGKTKYFNNCFVIYRIDGSCTDISYMKSINNPSKKFQIKSALRDAIKHDIQEFRKTIKYGIDRCIFTDEILLPENTHIDHFDLDFNVLANKFIEIHGEDYLFGEINIMKDNVYETTFNNLLLILKFRYFHNANTNLRAISKKANLSRPKK
jgi:hypothetical protein